MVGPQNEEVARGRGHSERGVSKFRDVFHARAWDRKVEDFRAIPARRANVTGPEDVDASVSDQKRGVIDRNCSGDGLVAREEFLCLNLCTRSFFCAGKRFLTRLPKLTRSAQS